MNHLGSHRARRLPALIACLALFLVGGNYCLLSAWGGNSRMACLVLPGVASAASAPRCQHCAPATKGAGTRQDGAKRSCCPDPVVAPSAPSVEKVVALSAPAAGAIFAAANVPTLPHPCAWHGRQAIPDGQPPTRLACAPLTARAPPLF